MNILIIILLAYFAIGQSIFNFDRAGGVDFYQFWGVSKAQKWSREELKSPYVEMSRYAAVLNAYADRATDPRLKRANKYNNMLYHDKLNLTATPLCYSIFGLLPADFSLAFTLFLTLEVVLFIGSILILGWSQEARSMLMVLSLLLVCLYSPLISDLFVGNFTSFQLFAIVLLTVFADRVLAAHTRLNVFGLGKIFMCILVFFTLIKPNAILVTVLLAAHYWVRFGARAFVRAALIAGAFGAVLLALPCLQFGSWRVWLDWFSYLSVQMAEVQLLFPMSNGNLAAVLLISQVLHMQISSSLNIMAAMLFCSALVALWMAVPLGQSFFWGTWETVRRLIGDPYFCAAAGVTVSLALAPLVWMHYYVLSLLPALWLYSLRHRRRHTEFLAAVSILLTSGVLTIWFSDVHLIAFIYVLGLLPLLAGVLMAMATKDQMKRHDLIVKNEKS